VKPESKSEVASPFVAYASKPIVIESFLKVLLWPGPRTVFEIGACEAEDTVRYARLFPRAEFFLFEPLPGNQRSIKARLAEHNEIRASLHGVALSDADGEAVFHVSSGASPTDRQTGNKSSSLLAPGELPEELQWIKFQEQITVPTMRLEKFCRDHKVGRIDYVHMDVQGAELRVLKGAGPKIDSIGLVWMEVSFKPAYDGQPLEAEATQWMESRGFRKVVQVSYGTEGDALYLNMRHPAAWLRLGLLQLLRRIGKVRLRWT
jgi:FkbM family methyltransferase